MSRLQLKIHDLLLELECHQRELQKAIEIEENAHDQFDDSRCMVDDINSSDPWMQYEARKHINYLPYDLISYHHSTSKRRRMEKKVKLLNERLERLNKQL
jgi:hypothetical protein